MKPPVEPNSCPQPETPLRERAWTDEQIEAMRKDAARYRWLRDALYQENIAVGEAELVLRVYGACPSIEQFDAAMQGATP